MLLKIRRGSRLIITIFFSLLVPAATLAEPVMDLSTTVEEPAVNIPIESDVWVTSQQTKEILLNIYLSNLREIEVGHLAITKSKVKEIQRYGRRLVRDHQVANETLREFINDEDIAMTERSPTGSDYQQRHSESLAKLQAAEGEEFDQVFLESMREAHTRMIRNLEQFIDSKDFTRMDGFASDRENTVDLAEKLLPILKQHLQLAEHLTHRTLAKK